MNRTPLKFPRPGQRYKLANSTRFVAVILVLLLAVTAVFVILQKNRTNAERLDQTSVVVTPIVMPTPKPTPPPIEIPEGKSMAPVSVVIDAGHGGRDGGTVSPYKDTLYEKDITLDIALKTEKYLKEKGVKVYLTRESDEHLSDVIKEDLVARADVANSNDASLFVSIHVNAYDLKYKGAAKVNGMEVYYFNKKETYDNFSEEHFAQLIGDEVSKANGVKFNGTKNNNYSVLRNTVMPAVLIETAYLTNKEDHARLDSETFRDKTAKGIAEGVSLALQEVKAFEYDGGMYVFKETGE